MFIEVVVRGSKFSPANLSKEVVRVSAKADRKCGFVESLHWDRPSKAFGGLWRGQSRRSDCLTAAPLVAAYFASASTPFSASPAASDTGSPNAWAPWPSPTINNPRPGQSTAILHPIPEAEQAGSQSCSVLPIASAINTHAVFRRSPYKLRGCVRGQESAYRVHSGDRLHQTKPSKRFQFRLLDDFSMKAEPFG